MQILLNMLLKFILAKGAIYELLTRGPLSQALLENVCLYTSRCILTHKAIKMNYYQMQVLKIDKHQKNPAL